MSLTHGSLFSGIGGFDLAAEWAGFTNLFHCEWAEVPRKTLKYYWPNAKSYKDITKTDFTSFRGKLDLLTGGFPCQPFSTAGKRKGANDNRYLWPQMLRAIKECKPTWVIGENVTGISSMVFNPSTIKVETQKGIESQTIHRTMESNGVLEQVCTDLEQAGYTVQPLIVPACAKNAPHRRDRVWIIAYSQHNRNNRKSTRLPSKTRQTKSRGQKQNPQRKSVQFTSKTSSFRGAYSYTQYNGLPTTQRRRKNTQPPQQTRANQIGQPKRTNCLQTSFTTHAQSRRHGGLRNTIQTARTRKSHFALRSQRRVASKEWNVTHSNRKLLQGRGGSFRPKTAKRYIGTPFCRNNWQNFPTESPLCGRNDGLPSKLDGITFSKWRNESIKAFGNAIVPQVAYEIINGMVKQQNRIL